ncbi:MAG TPA: NADH-quinone oxidoreductase subunit C [Chryseolinea sp.]|nr:NADH-quinone oxidoreductase subunit C [Chryseolinea sp.]HPM30412.1 NADH-quinone oxidoreductase subunit C [Chryseolinea sp.]
MSTFDQIVSIVKESCSHREVLVLDNIFPKAIQIPSADLIQVTENLFQNPELYFDMLSCITGIDNGAEANTMECVYTLYSIPFNSQLMLKVTLPRENPAIDSISHIWKSANWLEREIFDMYGIHFKNHPDLRRILLPADWDGHPLRKDYKQQEYYRGVKVES